MSLSLEGLALGYGILTCENYEHGTSRDLLLVRKLLEREW